MRDDEPIDLNELSLADWADALNTFFAVRQFAPTDDARVTEDDVKMIFRSYRDAVHTVRLGRYRDALAPLLARLDRFASDPVRLRGDIETRLAALESVAVLATVAGLQSSPMEFLDLAKEALEKTPAPPEDALPAALAAADIRASTIALLELVLDAAIDAQDADE